MSGPYALEATFDAAFFGNVPLGATVFAPLITSSYQHAYGNVYQNTTDLFEPQYATNIGMLLPSTTPLATLFQQGALPQTAIFSDMTPVVTGNTALTQALAIPTNNPIGALGFGPNNLVTNQYRVAYAADAAQNPDGATRAPQLAMQPPQIPPAASVQLAASPQNTFRIDLKLNDLRNGPFWAPRSPMLLCGGDEDPTVFFGLNTLTMAAYWTGLPTGLVTVLDVNAPPAAGNPFAAAQAGFQQTLAGEIASQGQQAAIASYHSTVAPFCTVAARGFFSQF
ncbi:MAG: alpha/beta hydrolase, partial [Steroidobacteraceae bacterium]